MRGFAIGLLATLAGCGSDIPGILDTIGFGHDGSGGEVETPTGSSSGTVLTSGETGSGSGGGSSSGSLDVPDEVTPVLVELHASPSPVLEVGEVQVFVSTSRPVLSIDLYDGDTPLVLGAAPGSPVFAFEVTSDDLPGDGTHTLRAVAHAADGVQGEDVEDLLIDVQPGGTDVWPPYVKPGPISGFTGAALLGNGAAASGFIEVNGKIESGVVRIDGTKGQPEQNWVLLGPLAQYGEGRGPAVAAAADDTLFVAFSRPELGSTSWAVTKVRLGDPMPIKWTQTGAIGTVAHAVAVAGEFVVVAGAVEVKPGTHNLKVWWLAAGNGAVLHEATFAAPVDEDPLNTRDEIAHGVAVVGEEIVIVGERQVFGDKNFPVRRTLVFRYAFDGDVLDRWTSPGELLDEDAGMAVTPLHAGGFVVTGWGRNKGTIRQVVTRWFTAEGEAGPVRVEPTPSNEGVGYAIAEDREGKIIVAGTLKQPGSDNNGWVFALPGPLGAHAWDNDVIRDGPSHGPDEAAGLVVDDWGYAYVVGSEFAELQPRAFALRLYP